MPDLPRPDLHLVRTAETHEGASQYALVLVAMGMNAIIGPNGQSFGVFVEQEDLKQARAELAAYDAENSGKAKEVPKSEQKPRIEAAMVYWAVLLFFFAAVRNDAFSIEWLRSGAAQAAVMTGGEWWRAVTALTLHVSSTHLLGNLVFGTFFSLQLARITGSGLAWLAMIIAGTAGNVINALVQSPAHTSIGASTALFAGIGLLAALRQYEKTANTAAKTLRAWAPLAGGFMLLAFLGFSGERTDIFAHIFGFFAGLAGGWWLGRQEKDWRTSDRFQLQCGAAAAWIVTIAWALAITTGG